MLRGADGDVLGGAELLKLNETLVRKIGEQVCVTNDSFVANDEARRLTAKLIGNRQLMLVVLILPAAGYAAAVAADAQLRRAAEASYRPRKAAAAKRPLTDAAARQLSVLGRECLVHSNATPAALPQGWLTAAEAAFCDERGGSGGQHRQGRRRRRALRPRQRDVPEGRPGVRGISASTTSSTF